MKKRSLNCFNKKGEIAWKYIIPLIIAEAVFLFLTWWYGWSLTAFAERMLDRLIN